MATPADGTDRSDDLLLARLSEAVDRIEHGVVIIDPAGTVLFRNLAAERFAAARDGLVLVEAAIEELLGDALAGRTARRSVELFGPPAQSFIVSAYAFPDGEGTGALAVVEDRSLQKRTETVRRDFVANISHELKTPIGALGLLAETIRDEPDHKVVERLAERMIIEADRVSRTVDDLLELSRIEFGDEAEFERLGVVSVVGEAEGRIASAAEQADITLVTDVTPSIEIEGDRRQLVSALFNLLDNAVKYSSPGAEVAVQAIDVPDAAWCDSRCPIPVWASPAGIWIGSSNASTGSTGPVPERPGEPAWAWRSSATSPATTAGRSPWSRPRVSARPSPSCFPDGPRSSPPRAGHGGPDR